MKAIVNVKNCPSYGLTFEVVDVFATQLVLNLGTKESPQLADFGFSEVIIVDFAVEYQRAFDSYNWGSGVTYNTLRNYKEANSIVFTPVYNCPD